jgi:threonyl-tRNA synthetase
MTSPSSLSEITIQLPDGSSRTIPSGSTVADLAASIGAGLARAALAGQINGRTVDLSEPIPAGATVRILTFKDEEGREVFRHSSTHLMAQAIKRLKPESRLTVGPPLPDGYFYDFDIPGGVSTEDFPAIEAEMLKIVSENLPIRRVELDREAARNLFTDRGETYKIEILDSIPGDEAVSCYEQGEFIDLCRGPHVPSTGQLKAVKLTALSGCYWRGDEKGPVLQRLYGTSFPDKKGLDEYLTMLEEAKKRDHRKLGRELDLFSFQESGPGFPFFHPNGMVVYNSIVDYLRSELLKRDYVEISTPMILDENLWQRTGHWDHYKENMYFTEIDGGGFAVKPMNCPGCTQVFRNNPRSYRDLPLKMAEFGKVHRHERSGVLHGLFRVRCFTQDDAHVFCTPDQLEAEVGECIELIQQVYETFGFHDYHMELSTRPEKSIGSDEDWENAENSLRKALEDRGIPYRLNPGDGAFYGPKIDFHVKDSLKRTWQCGTIQVDFSMPVRLDLHYVGPDGQKHRPIMVHRALVGSIERFMGVLIEHLAGKFPAWLAPTQVVVLPISEKVADYAQEVAGTLKKAGFRVQLDGASDAIKAKIARAETAKIPYMLVVGQKEAEKRAVAVRRQGVGDLGARPLGQFLADLRMEVDSKSPSPVTTA